MQREKGKLEAQLEAAWTVSAQLLIGPLSAAQPLSWSEGCSGVSFLTPGEPAGCHTHFRMYYLSLSHGRQCHLPEEETDQWKNHILNFTFCLWYLLECSGLFLLICIFSNMSTFIVRVCECVCVYLFLKRMIWL